MHCRRFMPIFFFLSGIGLLLSACAGVTPGGSSVAAQVVSSEIQQEATSPSSVSVVTQAPLPTATSLMPSEPVEIPAIPTLLPSQDQPFAWLRIEDINGLHEKVVADLLEVEDEAYYFSFALSRWWNPALERWQRDFLLKLAEGVYVTFPVQFFQRAYWQGEHHIVTLENDEELEGLLDFTLYTPDLERYDFQTALSVVRTCLPDTVEEEAVETDFTWELHVTAPVDITYEVTNVDFTYVFYTTRGWAIGGGDAVAMDRETFYVRTPESDTGVNLPDVDEISFTRDGYETLVTVREGDGDELTGQLVLLEQEETRVREAHIWFLEMDRTDVPMSLILGNATYTLRRLD